MRSIWLIARREIMAYLRTPSGYIIAATALLLNALHFNALAVGEGRKNSEEVLELFLFNAAFVTEAVAVLLSMRMLAAERSSGTQMMLFTSPVREREIVFGKYLAAFFVLSVITLMSLYLPALIFVNGKVSLGHIAGGYGGLILLGAAILAVGMFASSLMPHPFIAVLLATVFVGLLEMSYFVAKISDPPFQSFVGWLSPVWKHFRSFRRGLLQMSDILFYCSLIYLSLLATIKVLKSQRWQ